MRTQSGLGVWNFGSGDEICTIDGTDLLVRQILLDRLGVWKKLSSPPKQAANIGIVGSESIPGQWGGGTTGI